MAVVIIEGPEAELIFREDSNPMQTDIIPTTVDTIIIFFGLSDKFLAVAAGIINIPVINNKPTILIAIAIMAAIRRVKIIFMRSGFMPSALASS